NSPGVGCATITFSPPASTCLAVPTGTSAVGRDASGTEVVDWAVDAGSGGSVIPHAERIPGSTTTPGSAARTARRCVHGPTVVGGASRGAGMRPFYPSPPVRLRCPYDRPTPRAPRLHDLRGGLAARHPARRRGLDHRRGPVGVREALAEVHGVDDRGRGAGDARGAQPEPARRRRAG